jgi:Sec-independent protein translocase protein TatA
MKEMMASVHFLAFFLGGEEAVLVLLCAVILLMSSRIPGFALGFRRAIEEFRKASRDVASEVDQAGFDAGQSVSGIHGKEAAEALTTDNQTVELYDPEVLHASAPVGHRNGRPNKSLEKGTTRKLLFIAAGFVFGMEAYRLYKSLVLNSN